MIKFKNLKKNALLFFLNSCFCLAIVAQNVTLSGYVYDDATGESLVGVTVQARAASKGAATNNYGFYSFSLPAGTQVPLAKAKLPH
jgi:CarboxypepD_reg-like domain